ncbi:MAG: hypothetical protein JSY10_17935 [Paenibacillus sp.]|nr:hypothetical protein [Paenibacillus sp.]
MTVDLGYKALQHFNKLSHKAAVTIDIGPNVMLAIKYIAGSLIVYKSIDVSIWYDFRLVTTDVNILDLIEPDNA